MVETTDPIALMTRMQATQSCYVSGWTLRTELTGDCCAQKVAGLPDQYPEGTEERQALHNKLYAAFPQRGLPQKPHSQKPYTSVFSLLNPLNYSIYCIA